MDAQLPHIDSAELCDTIMRLISDSEDRCARGRTDEDWRYMIEQWLRDGPARHPVMQRRFMLANEIISFCSDALVYRNRVKP